VLCVGRLCFGALGAVVSAFSLKRVQCTAGFFVGGDFVC